MGHVFSGSAAPQPLDGAARQEEHRPMADPHQYCDLPPQPVRVLPPDITHDRARAIIVGASKWVNKTVLRYYFFDRPTDGEEVILANGTRRFVSWLGEADQMQAVRDAFATWKGLPLGLEFEEVDDRGDAEIRIGFMDGDGSWSYVGRGVLGQGANARTMNFGWDLTTAHGRDTALHEIGHTLGMPHEHQNPFAGIVWDEPAVYTYFGGPPNNWPRDKTFHNVLRKLNRNEVSGSPWDPDSVMHYDFRPGLIKEPPKYRQEGISPPGGLSPADMEWARKWYPGEAVPAERRLVPFQSASLSLKAGEQADFVIEPPGSRRYQIATFGTADTVMVLFEDIAGQLRYVKGDDDSGTDSNARIEQRLVKGRRYVVRLRLYWAGDTGETAVMCW
jgi:Astacin (Peptidase family M12A)